MKFIDDHLFSLCYSTFQLNFLTISGFNMKCQQYLQQPACSYYLLILFFSDAYLISDALYTVGFVHLAGDQSCTTISHSLTWSSLNLFKVVMSFADLFANLFSAHFISNK